MYNDCTHAGVKNTNMKKNVKDTARNNTANVYTYCKLNANTTNVCVDCKCICKITVR